MAKSNTLLYAGGAAALAILFLKKSSPAAAAVYAPGQAAQAVTTPGAPAPPLSYNDAYYKTYQYPALIKKYPELTNPNHTLTQQEANDYKMNYLELQQWLPSVLGSKNWQFPTELAALQYHWKKFGVPYQYSFIPFTPPKNVNWTPPPPAPTSSGDSGGGFLGTLVSIASTVAMFLGTDDERLNDTEVEILMTAAPMIEKISGFYLQSDKTLVTSINDKLNSLVSEYAY